MSAAAEQCFALLCKQQKRACEQTLAHRSAIGFCIAGFWPLHVSPQLLKTVASLLHEGLCAHLLDASACRDGKHTSLFNGQCQHCTPFDCIKESIAYHT